MFWAFRMDPAASGLYDIDRVLFRVTQSRVKKLGSPGKTIISIFPFDLESANFRRITLKNTLSISQSPRPLAVGPKCKTENIESHRF